MDRKSTEWKKKKYIQACNLLDYVNQKANFCNIRKTDCGIGCNSIMKYKTDQLCCDGCLHLGESGCKVKSLGCKLYFCFFGSRPSAFIELTEEQKKHESRFVALRELIIRFMVSNNVPIYADRMSMKESFARRGIEIEENF